MPYKPRLVSKSFEHAARQIYSQRRSTRPRIRLSGYAGWTCSFSLRCQTLMTRAGNTGDAPLLVAIISGPRLGNVCRSDGAVDDFASPFKGSEDRTASRQLRGRSS